MSYSLDFRIRVFEVQKKEGLTFRETAVRFGVPIRTLFRWRNRLDPCITRQKPAAKIDMEALRKHVQQYPDAYQYERAAVFSVSQGCIFFALKRLGISHKKTLFHPRADQQRRAEFAARLHQYQCMEKRAIVYIDESGFALDAPGENGYNYKGSRSYAGKDWHRKGRVNAIGAIHGFRILNVCLFESNINADVFYSWVNQQLLPSLPKRTVIVMDNATFHKRADSREAIIAQGHDILFLPPYSPDRNPIEKKWAQAKSIRKKFRCDPYQLFQNYKI